MSERPTPPSVANAGPLDENRTPVDRAAFSTWELRFLVAVILVAILALFAVAILFRERIFAFRDVIETRIDPARDVLGDLQLTIAREGAVIRTFLLTPSPAVRARYYRLRAAEEQQLRRLEAFGDWPGEQIDAGIARLRDEAEAWHRAHDSLLAGNLTPEAYAQISPPEDPRHERIIQIAQAVDAELARYCDGILAEMTEAQQLVAVLTVGLTLLALVALMAVVRIQQRLRELARRLERWARRETALRKAAESLGAPASIDSVLATIASSAVPATQADGAFVERLDPDRRVLRVVSAAGRFVPQPGAEEPFSGSYAEKVIAAGKPQVIIDFGRQERSVPKHLFAHCQGCHAVVVPLADGGEAFGAVFLLRAPGRRPFDQDDVADAAIFGNLASLAFQAAKALEDSEAARRELERVSELRARLTRGFSHDVKNPLGAADGYLELLEMGVQGELRPDQRESVARSRRLITKALELIDNLVDVARAEEGRLQVEMEPVDIGDVVRATAEEYRAQAEQAGLTLDVEIADPAPVIPTDRDRIAQILSNLVSNAVKYTPPGGRVTIRARRCDTPPPGARKAPRAREWVCLDVTDTGPGIPPDKLDAIFEEFVRIEPRKRAGTGLGLSISRRIARLLHGDLTVQSEVGRGSTFTVWLPVEIAAEATGEERGEEGGAANAA